MDLQILNADDVRSLVKECALLRSLMLKTWWAPAQGNNVAVYRPLEREDADAISKYLLSIGAERYVPKKERKP